MVYCVEMILEEFRSVPLGGYLAAAVWIGSMIMQSILINQKKIYTGGQKKIDAAVAAGNVARARLERVERKNRGSESSSYRYRGVYTYTAPLFKGMTIDSTQWCFTGTSTLADDIKAMCRREVFNGLREYPEYREILA